MPLPFNMLSWFAIAFLPRSKRLFKFLGCSHHWQWFLQPKTRKYVTSSTCSLSICREVIGLDAMILVFIMLILKPAFSSSPSHQEATQFLFTFCHQSGIICISEVVDISPSNLDSSLWPTMTFHMIYSAWKLNNQGDNIQPCHTPFPILNQSVVPRPVLTVAS